MRASKALREQADSKTRPAPTPAGLTGFYCFRPSLENLTSRANLRSLDQQLSLRATGARGGRGPGLRITCASAPHRRGRTGAALTCASPSIQFRRGGSFHRARARRARRRGARPGPCSMHPRDITTHPCPLRADVGRSTVRRPHAAEPIIDMEPLGDRHLAISMAVLGSSIPQASKPMQRGFYKA